MEQQVNYVDRPRSSTGGKVFLILEMFALIFMKIFAFIAMLFPTDAASNMPIVKVVFWIGFFAYLAGYILLIIGTSSRNFIGVLIAGFVLFMILEWEALFTSFTSMSSLMRSVASFSAIRQVILYSFTFVWISLIVLTCIKKAPKALCLIPGIIAILASVFLLYTKILEMTMWSSISKNTEGNEIAYLVFSRIASFIELFIILFRPFWIFMVAHWLTHPTYKVALRPVAPRVVNQPVQAYAPVPSYQPVQPGYQPVYQQVPQPQVYQPGYQPVPQGYQQVPQQGYPQYGQPQQFPPQQ